MTDAASRHIDFTGEIVLFGPATFHGESLWSIVRVEQHFSGEASSLSNLVVVRGFFKPNSREKYFVEGSRSRVAFTDFLPMIEPVSCGHTRTRDHAAVALRILRDGPPKSGARLIGRVYEADSEAPAPGVGIDIEGRIGSVYKVTDAQGIYDATGVPSGHYTVRLAKASPERQVLQVIDLKPGDVGEWAFPAQ